MSLTRTMMTDPLHAYMLALGTREPDAARRLRERGNQHPDREMQSSVEAAQFLALLVEIVGAKRIVEIGTFIGYATLRMALALPPDGRIFACDVSEAFVSIGRPFWQDAGVSDKIDVRIAPALDTLAALHAQYGTGSIDIIFIDADKPNYPAYYEPSLALLRSGGILIVDNVFWSGEIVNADDPSESTQALRTINALIHADKRLSIAMLPLADGVTLARKI
jgi:predicted O-methyltransferase YrrM